MGPPTGLSQEHNLCLVTDTSAARSSAPLPARDVRDEPKLSPARRAHPTRLLYPRRGLRSQARRSPPTPDLLRRAGPVNRGAVGGRVQLDGRRLLLGHSGPGKALLTPRGGRPLSCFLPLNCPTPAAQGQVGATGPGAAFGGRAPRGPFCAEGPLAVSGDPRPTRPGLGLARKESKGFPGGAARQRGIPSLFSSVNRSLGFDRHRHSPAPASAWKVQPPPAPSPPLRAAVPGREWRAEEGRGRGKPRPSTRTAAFPTHPLGSAPFAAPAANGSTPRRQMTRKYVTGARRTALGAESGSGSTAPSAAPRHLGRTTGKGGRGSGLLQLTARWASPGPVRGGLLDWSAPLGPGHIERGEIIT